MGAVINVAKKISQKMTSWMPNWLKGTLQVVFPPFMLANAGGFGKLPIANGFFKGFSSLCEKFVGSFLSGNVLGLLGGLAGGASSMSKIADLAESIAPAFKKEPPQIITPQEGLELDRIRRQNAATTLAWAMAKHVQ